MTAVMDYTAEDLRTLNDYQIAELWGRDMDAAELAALQGETARREANRKAHARRRADPVSAEWRDMAYAQYLQAEEELRGELTNGSEPKGFDPWLLWSGPLWQAEHYASFELIRWWESHPRVTVTEYREQSRLEREAETDDAMDRDDRGGVRREADQGPQGARGDQDRAGHVVPAVAPRGQAGAGGRAGADAGRDAAVRPDVITLTEDSPVSVIPGRSRSRLIITPRVPESNGEAGRSAESVSERLSLPALPVTPAVLGSPGTVAVRERSAVIQARPDINGDATLRYVYTFLKRFAVWPSEAALVAATLWIAQAHARDEETGLPVWEYASRFLVVGPYGCGKSRIARLIAKLCPEGEMLLEPTKAALVDMIADHKTVVMTEVDELFYTSYRNRPLLAILNAGYEPDHQAPRKHGGKVLKVPLFGPAVLDGLDVLIQATRPDLRTLISRCIVMHAVKAPEGYQAPRFDKAARAIAAQLSNRLATWMAQEVAAGIGDEVPNLPEALGNRTASLWEPLFTVALRADEGDPEGPWSAACRDAWQHLENAAGLPDQDDESLSELDRVMAEWGGE